MKNPSGFTCDRNTPHRAALDSILPYVTLFFRKEEFMKICSVLFTSLLLLSARASTADSDAIPGWAKEVFSQKLAARYRYCNGLHPSHFEADFNGDKKQDVAVLIRNKSSGKIGIAIILRDKGVTILGAGTPFGNGGDNFDWMNRWSISRKRKVNVEADGGTPTLIGDALLVEKIDSASAIVFWNGKEYQWYQQGD